MNKKKEENKLPKYELHMLMGGRFQEGGKSEDMGIKINLAQIQYVSILKFLEFSGFYSQFQTGVLSQYLAKTFSSELKDQYVYIYIYIYKL